MAIRGIATADLHLGIDSVGGLNDQGLPARVDDYFKALDFIIAEALERNVDLFVIAGDLTRHRNPPQRIVAPLFERLAALTQRGIAVVLVRGNHDGDSGIGRGNLLDSAATINPHLMTVFNGPYSWRKEWAWDGSENSKACWIAGIPWPRVTHKDDLPLDQQALAADEEVRATIRNIVVSGAELDRWDFPQILVGHLAVAGAGRASDQWMTLGYEPLVRPVDFPKAFDLVILGHYHKPGRIEALGRPGPIFYCGSPVTVDFGEAGQEKSCWYFELDGERPAGERCTKLEAIAIPGRPFVTLAVEFDADVPPAEQFEHLALALATGHDLHDAIVRAKVTCATAEQAAALDANAISATLKAAGAWWVQGVTIEAPRPERRWQLGEGLIEQSPQDLLARYLSEAEPDEERRRRLHAMAVGEMEA